MTPETLPDEKASILLVDDRQANLTALHAILEPLGQRLVCAQSGEEALRQLLARDFALLLLDVQMPGIDGFQVASLVRQRPATAHLPIIFLTAYSREATEIFTGYEHGAVDYLLKPFDPYILRAKVSVFVDLYKKTRLIERQAELLRRQEREALERTSERRFRSVTESIAACIWAAGPDGHFLYANRCARAFGGDSVEFLQAVHPADRPRAREVWTGAIASGRPFELEVQLGRRSDGAARCHLVRGVIQHGEGSEPDGWIVSGADIEDLKQANRAKDAFLAIASHELRAPLSVVLAQTEPVLLLRQEEAGYLDKVFAVIRRQTERMSRLVGDLLDIGRIQAGKLSILREEFDICELAAEVVDRLRLTSPQHAIRLSVAGGPLRLEADPGRIDQVLTNLLSNAIRYSPDGGDIELVCSMHGGSVHLSVIDHGIGIPPDKLAAIFDAFERAHGSSYGGLGLGLNIARGIVEQHGGRIWAVSTGTPGEGSEFHVLLPAVLPVEEVAAPPQAMA